MATDRLRAKEPLAVDLLSLCAFLAPEAIPRRLLADHHEALPEELGAAVAEPLRLNRLVAALRRYSLVEVTGEALSFHRLSGGARDRLVQAAARDALAADETRRWVEAAVALMRAAFPYDRDDPATWAPSGALLAHALAAAGSCREDSSRPPRNKVAAQRGCRYLETRASSSGPEPAMSGRSNLPRLLSARMTPKWRHTSTTWACAAGPGRSGGRQGSVRAGAQRSTRRASAPTTPTSPSTSTTWAGCCRPGRSGGRQGGLRAGAGDWRDDVWTRASAPTTPRSRPTSTTWARCCRHLGDLAGARAAFERALAIDEKSFGPDHPQRRDRRQQPGRGAASTRAIWRAPGRPTSGRSAIDEKAASAPTTPTSRATSTTWARLL